MKVICGSCGVTLQAGPDSGHVARGICPECSAFAFSGRDLRVTPTAGNRNHAFYLREPIDPRD